MCLSEISREEPDGAERADWARMSLYVFAELSQTGGTNAVADVEGIAEVVPELFGSLFHLLDLEGLSIGQALSGAFGWYSRETAEGRQEVPDPIAMLHTLFGLAHSQNPGLDSAGRLGDIETCFRVNGWSSDGSPFGV